MSLGAVARGDEPFLVLPVHCRSLRPDLISVLMQPSIAVVVVSGDRIFCEVLAASLSRHEGLEGIAAPGGAGGVDREGSPQVVLIDASFDAQSSLARTWEVRARWPDAKIIAVGLDQEDEQVVDFAEAGALGYALKGSTLDELVETVHAVHRGQTLCSPRILAAVVARITSLSRVGTEPPQRQVEPLTAREQEILALVAGGLSNKDVGRQLGITVQTVKNHVHRVLEKLQCHRRREAVRLAYDLGLLTEPHEGPPPAGAFDFGRKGTGGVDPF